MCKCMFVGDGRAHGARGLAGVEHVHRVVGRARRQHRAPRRAPARARRRHARRALAGGQCIPSCKKKTHTINHFFLRLI